MKSRLLVAAVGVPLTLIMLVLLPDLGAAIFCAAISCVAVQEMFAAVGVRSVPALVLGCVSAMLITAMAYFGTSAYIVLAWCCIYGVLLFFLWVAYYEREKVFGFAGFGGGLMAGLIIPGGMAALVLLRIGIHGRFAVLLPIIIAYAGDGGALFAGMLFGKHKLAPRTSPKKTIEGGIGGLIVAVGLTLLYGVLLRFAFSVSVNFPMLALTALISGFAAPLGDLAFSLIKREFGVKDYGRLLPGHGGALDRFDSTVFAAPTVYLLLTALNVLG